MMLNYERAKVTAPRLSDTSLYPQPLAQVASWAQTPESQDQELFTEKVTS